MLTKKGDEVTMVNLKNVTYEDPKDIELIEKGINYNAWLMCGNDTTQQKNIKNNLINKCIRLNIIGQYDKHSILSEKTLGYLSADKNQNYVIEMYGYKDSFFIDHPKLVYTSVHEFCHAMQHVMCDSEQFSEYNNCKYYNHGGIIVEESKDSKNLDSYGNTFCETITDLLTLIAIIYQDNNYSKFGLDADKILTSNCTKIVKDSLGIDGYSIYTSIAILALAAFNNSINCSYDNLIKNGQSIVSAQVVDKLGNTKPLNDMLYGIMFDSKYIEDCYNKYMGNNSYYELCKQLDLMLKTGRTNPFIMQEIMQSLSIFHNRKNQDLFKLGAITEEELLESISSFNNIFNKVQNDFNAYFFKTDLPSLNYKIPQLGKRQ